MFSVVIGVFHGIIKGDKLAIVSLILSGRKKNINFIPEAVIVWKMAKFTRLCSKWIRVAYRRNRYISYHNLNFTSKNKRKTKV